MIILLKLIVKANLLVIVEGMISGISNLIFQSPITCKLRAEKIILLYPSDKEMVEAAYDLNLQAIKNEDPLIIPLMLAQTNKNSEKKISRSVSCAFHNFIYCLVWTMCSIGCKNKDLF